MALLKKIKAATLMETLVATVLIFVIFMIASVILNNLFSNSIKNNTRAVDTRLYTLQYLWQNDQLQLPYDEELGTWMISVEKITDNGLLQIAFGAKNKDTDKEVSILVLDD